MLLYRYGVRATTEECPFAVFLQSVQSIVGVIIQVLVHCIFMLLYQTFAYGSYTTFLFEWNRGLQRDVVYLGWPMAPTNMSPNAEDRGGGSVVSANEYSCAHGAQINFGDLTPYFIQWNGASDRLVFVRRLHSDLNIRSFGQFWTKSKWYCLLSRRYSILEVWFF